MSSVAIIPEIHEQHPEEQQELSSSQSEEQEQEYSAPIHMKLLVAYLYFVQGLILSLPGTMTLVYAELPSYSILTIFSAASLPFSTKFIVAPFIQKHTQIEYGKRKTWIILSQFIAGALILLSAFLTADSHQVAMGCTMVACVFFVTLQDISLDAMAIKELKKASLVGMLQSVMQTTGVLIGSACFLKLTSIQFAECLGWKEAITQPPVFLCAISLCVILPTIFIHLLYEETTLASQRTIMQKPLCSIIKVYKVFFDFKSRFSITFFLLLVSWHGFTYFEAGYSYELIKAGFLKNTINTISNASLLLTTIITFFLSQKLSVEKQGVLEKLLLFQMAGKWLIYVFLYIFFPTSVEAITVVVFLLQGLDMLSFLLVSTFVNSFPVTGVSGMIITMLVSASNFGEEGTLAMWLTGKFGWKATALFGLCLQLILMPVFSKLYRKAEIASCEIDLIEGKQQQEECPLKLNQTQKTSISTEESETES